MTSVFQFYLGKLMLSQVTPIRFSFLSHIIVIPTAAFAWRFVKRLNLQGELGIVEK